MGGENDSVSKYQKLKKNVSDFRRGADRSGCDFCSEIWEWMKKNRSKATLSPTEVVIDIVAAMTDGGGYEDVEADPSKYESVFKLSNVVGQFKKAALENPGIFYMSICEKGGYDRQSVESILEGGIAQKDETGADDMTKVQASQTPARTAAPAETHNTPSGEYARLVKPNTVSVDYGNTTVSVYWSDANRKTSRMRLPGTLILVPPFSTCIKLKNNFYAFSGFEERCPESRYVEVTPLTDMELGPITEIVVDYAKYFLSELGNANFSEDPDIRINGDYFSVKPEMSSGFFPIEAAYYESIGVNYVVRPRFGTTIVYDLTTGKKASAPNSTLGSIYKRSDIVEYGKFVHAFMADAAAVESFIKSVSDEVGLPLGGKTTEIDW